MDEDQTEWLGADTFIDRYTYLIETKLQNPVIFEEPAFIGPQTRRFFPVAKGTPVEQKPFAKYAQCSTHCSFLNRLKAEVSQAEKLHARCPRGHYVNQ